MNLGQHLPAAKQGFERTIASVVQKIRRYGARQAVSTVLLVFGLVLIFYVAASYGFMYGQQRRLMQEWREQQNFTSGTTSTEPNLTRLLIPKINLDVVTVEGTSHRALTQGPGHLVHTALPGDPGNAVIAAHRDTYFRHVYQLKPGDDIFVERAGRKYHYVVTSKRVVQPTDLSVLDTSSESRLTLITCYPIYFVGPAPERLIVFAKLVNPV